MAADACALATARELPQNCNPALVGTILGYQVKVNQNNFNMIGLSNFDGHIDLALLE